MRYTSYAILFFLLVGVTLLLFFTRQHVAEADITQSGSINISGVVPGPPPSTPATISEPVDNQHVATSVISAKGSCTPGLIVEIWRNNAEAGSTICDGTGNYSIQVTLLPGENKLRARISDSLGQYGPDSQTISVFYDVPSIDEILADADAGSKMTRDQAAKQEDILTKHPLLLFSNPVHAGYYIGGKTKLPYELNGGQAPYAVSVDWNDGSKNSLASHDKAGDYIASHVYSKAGQYQVTITATDQFGTQAIFQTILIINGDKAMVEGAIQDNCKINNTAPNCPVNNQLLQHIDQAWPAVAGATLMAGSFWLGERVVFYRLSRGLKAKRT